MVNLVQLQSHLLQSQLMQFFEHFHFFILQSFGIIRDQWSSGVAKQLSNIHHHHILLRPRKLVLLSK